MARFGTALTRLVVVSLAMLPLAVTVDAAPVSAAKTADATLSFNGEVTAREQVGKKCRFQGEFAVAAEIDGKQVAGEVQARWRGPCDPDVTIGTQLLNGVADVDFTRFMSSGSANPTVLRFRGKVVDWVQPLEFMSTGGGNPTVLRFQFQGFMSGAGGDPTV